MAKNTTLKAIKRALRKPGLYSDDEYQYLVNGYHQAMVKKELKKQLVKQKGFGYVSKPSINNSTSGADDGVTILAAGSALKLKAPEQRLCN